MKSFIKFLVFLAVGLSILYFVYVNQAAGYQLECQCKTNAPCELSLIEKIMQDFKSTNIFWLLMICVAFMISNISRALRWNQLIEPLGYQPKLFNTFFATMIGYMVNLALPRAGEIAKPATVTQYEKIPLEKLVGTIVVDRIFDVLMLLLVIGLTFITQFNHLYDFLFGTGTPEVECVVPMAAPEPSVIPWGSLFAGAFMLGLVSVIVVFLRWDSIKKTAIAQKVITLLKNFLDGLKTVLQLKSPMMFIVHTLVIWLMYYLMMYVCFFAYGPTAGLSPLAALLAFTFGTFGMVIPSPGGMGTYQIAVTAALVVYGVAEPDAFAYSNIVFFTITIFCNIGFGLLGYILLPIYNKNYEPVLPENY